MSILGLPGGVAIHARAAEYLAMSYVGVVSYSAAGMLFLAFSVLLMTSWRGHRQGGLLLLASLLSAVWTLVLAAQSIEPKLPLIGAFVAETLRDGAWLAFLLGLVDTSRRSRRIKRLLKFAHMVWIIPVFGVIGLATWNVGVRLADEGVRILYVLLFVPPIAGVVVVEQIYRNLRQEQRWALKYLCLGLGGMFSYDIYMYSTAMLALKIDSHLWDARGAVNAMIVPLLAVSAARNPQWSLDLFVSRRVVFFTSSLLTVGIYLVAIGVGGYYVREHGGTWGAVAQVAFLFGSGLALLVILFSGRARSRLKVFVNKHFYNYKYDYREEWLRLIQTLSAGDAGDALQIRGLQSIARIVDSPAASMWLCDDMRQYTCSVNWNTPRVNDVEDAEGDLVQFLIARDWVIELAEVERRTDHYGQLVLPAWVARIPRAWLIVPLKHGSELLGFAVLTEPRAPRGTNWEDWDLLKTAGREVAGYIAFQHTSEQLSQARQFEAFSRLSAFVVHDLKNLVAQLTLVLSNAQRHKHNPAFMEDAMHTVENAVGKMSRMLEQLRKRRFQSSQHHAMSLNAVVAASVEARADVNPAARYIPPAEGLWVMGDRERLQSALIHLIQNAQEATPADGQVMVSLGRDGDTAVLSITDDGCGMDESFVRDRLFKPFDTTKGNAGMGIGVYESRDIVVGMGGAITVDSRVGYGTKFSIRLPLLEAK